MTDPAPSDGEVPAGRLAAGWRGVIRHVQSRKELRFTELREALAFMDTYVTLEDEVEEGSGE